MNEFKPGDIVREMCYKTIRESYANIFLIKSVSDDNPKEQMFVGEVICGWKNNFCKSQDEGKFFERYVEKGRYVLLSLEDKNKLKLYVLGKNT